MENGITGKLRFTVEDKRFNLSFERYYLSDMIERIKVYGKNSEMLLQCDRPEIKNNNKRRAIKWKVISKLNPEIYKHPTFISQLTIYLEDALDNIDFPRDPFYSRKN